MSRSSPPILRAASVAAVALPILFAAPAHALPSAEDVEFSTLAGAYLAARTADVENDVQSAAFFYREALRADRNSLYLLERAVVLSTAAGDISEALAFAGRLLETSPRNPVARLVLAVEAIREGRYAEAIENLQETDGGVLADLTEALVTAWATYGQSGADQALDDLARLSGETWYEPFKLLHSGYIALAAGRTSEALSALEAAWQADGNAVRITETYARALAVAGRSEEAEETLEDFLERFPDNALALAALEDVRRGDSSTVATPAAGVAEALAGVGAAVGQEGGTEVAYLYLRLALYLEPNIAGGLGALSLGNLLQANGQGEAAIEVLESIAPDAPFRSLGQLRAALALDRMDRTEEAEAAFQAAIASDPESIQSYISYGNMLRGRERFAEAGEIYARALDLIPEPGPADWSLYYFRGICYERTGQWEEAEADFRTALELSPDQPLLLNYLGYSLVDMGRNLEEAMEMIRKAVELRPNDGYIVDSLGWAHYRLGNFEDAVTELERAVALRPHDPVINDHLGDAYWQTGRVLEAQFQWRHARDFGAEGDDLELVLRKIAEGRLVEPEEVEEASYYTVQPGDSLWTISDALLDSADAYERLIESNPETLKDPNLIYPGMRLRIPGST